MMKETIVLDKVYKPSDIEDRLYLNWMSSGYFKGDDELDMLQLLWQENGYCGFRNGLFWLVDPDRFTPIARQFSATPEGAVAFARSAFGGIFLWESDRMGNLILYLMMPG